MTTILVAMLPVLPIGQRNPPAMADIVSRVGTRDKSG